MTQPDPIRPDPMEAEIDDILEDLVIYSENRYSDPVYAKNGIDRWKAKDKLAALLRDSNRRSRIDERKQAQSFLHGLTITPENRHLFDVLSSNNHKRIAELEAGLEGASEERGAM